jgi:hypothetical protein
LLKNSFGCQRVEVLEHGVSNVSAHVEIFCWCLLKVRKRHAEFPISIGDDYDFRQPASVVHVGMVIYNHSLNTSCPHAS